jgi:benzoylformate decarboxylase
MKPIAKRLAGHDVVLLVGAQVFRYYPHIPGPILPDGTRLLHLTDDPDEAARAPAGSSIVGDVRAGLERLAELIPESDRPGPPPRPASAETLPTEPMTAAYVFHELAKVLPTDSVVVEEAASSRADFFDQVRINQPGSYFFTGSGGLGFALPASVGIGLARPGRPVVCVAGDGAAMFGIHAIWTAARYEVPVVYIVVNNGQYGILKAFAAFQRTPGVPGLDLPGLDIAQVARGLGAEACRVTSFVDLADKFRAAFESAQKRSGPVLLDVAVDPEVGALFGEPVS